MKYSAVSRFVLSLAGLAACAPAVAFDAETHMVITSAAYNRSALSGVGPGSLAEALGIDRLVPQYPFAPYWGDPTTGKYYDNLPIDDPSYPYVMPGLDYTRKPALFEQCQMSLLAYVQAIDISIPAGQSLQKWLLRGVSREDDVPRPMDARCAGYPGDDDPRENFHRVFNHFYDPIHDIPLTPGLGGKKSVDWALGYIDSFATNPQLNSSRINHFTYADARDNQWMALTGQRHGADLPYTAANREKDAEERLYRWATVFRSLGDVVHLLQDAAQPQHVRNDAHSPTPDVSPERSAFEAYTNARIFGSTELGINSYIFGFFITEPIALPAVPLGIYPAVMFSTPLRFFTTRNAGDGAGVLPDYRYGMADYANRGFFTGGTKPNDARNTFMRPESTIDTAHGYVRSEVECHYSGAIAPRATATCVHWLNDVPDSVVPGYADMLPYVNDTPVPFAKSPLLSESVFAGITDVLGQPMEQRYAMGLEEFQNIANLSIPRSVGYTAGMLNYFFRGRLALSSPPDGLYAVVDHAKAHTVLDGGIPVFDDGTDRTFGFTRLRVRARNATGDIVEAGTGRVVPQTMVGASNGNGGSGGLLVAVARYHRNPCYQRDLSKEYVQKYDFNGNALPVTAPSGCEGNKIRSRPPEISVSRPVFIDLAGDIVMPATGASADTCANIGNINTGVTSGNCANDAALLEFNFDNDAIPINAVDVFVQVVYRGKLGEETDAIAVGSKDISEPQYYTSWNNTDWFLKGEEWMLPADVPAAWDEPSRDPENVMEVHICLNQQLIGHFDAPAGMPPAQFVRLATLVDKGDVNFGAMIRGETGPAGPITDGPWPGIVSQAGDDAATQNWVIDPMWWARGTTLGQGLSHRFHHTVGSWHYIYRKVTPLEPRLGDPGNPGIPMPLRTIFTGKSDVACQAFQGGQGAGAALRHAPAEPESAAKAGGLFDRGDE